MIRQFAPKTTVLVANTQATMTWGIAEFNSTIGGDDGVIHQQIALSAQVINNTAQVCYIGVKYSTRYNDYNLSDKTSVAAVPAGKTVNLTPASISSFAVLGPEITSISFTLLSASAGNVTVILGMDSPYTSGAMAGQSSYIGTDQRSTMDYIPIVVSPSFIVAPNGGSGSTSAYQVPSGKRALLKFASILVPITPSYPAQMNVAVYIQTLAGTFYILFENSRIDQTVTQIVFPELWLEQSWQVFLSGFNNTAVNQNASANVYLQETF